MLANGLTPMPIPEGKGGDRYDWGAEPVEDLIQCHQWLWRFHSP